MIAWSLGWASGALAAAPTTGSAPATTAVAPPSATAAATAPTPPGWRPNRIVVPPGPWHAVDLTAASGQAPRIREAIAVYERRCGADGQPPACAWRLAKAYFHLYDELPRDADEERTRAAERAVHFGELALRALPEDPHAVYWYAQALLALSDMKGALTFIGRIGEIRRRMEQVRALAPELDDGGPDRFFAIVDLQAPWPFGDRERALRYAEAALRYGPDRCVNLYVYASALIVNDRSREAVPFVERLERRDCTASSRMWSDIYVEKAAELREAL